ncbi:hypothetical protein BRD05_04980 [Halobacteriales archaeon QS_9_70_65]|nr:MAG: hypothetical protein BRD05_04980 [Halobacteriales archaeon QS_9_70_65]
MTDGDLERRDLLRGVAGAATAPFFVNSVAGQQTPDEGPAGVHAAYGRDPASTLRIGWSGAPAAEARLEIGRPDEPKTTVAAEANPLPGQEAVAYAATVTGLASGATYEYEAILDGRRAGPFEVETAPDTTDGFSVTAVSDHGIADPENAFQRPDDENPDEVMAVAQSLDSDLQILAGDISYANGVPSTWELYFDTFEDFFAETPFMTAAGNHEAEPGTALVQYDRRLNDLMPIDDPLSPDDTQHEQRWYHFDYDNTRFVALSTSTDGCGDVSRGEEFVPIYDPRCEAGGVTYGDVRRTTPRGTCCGTAGAPSSTSTASTSPSAATITSGSGPSPSRPAPAGTTTRRPTPGSTTRPTSAPPTSRTVPAASPTTASATGSPATTSPGGRTTTTASSGSTSPTSGFASSTSPPTASTATDSGTNSSSGTASRFARPTSEPTPAPGGRNRRATTTVRSRTTSSSRAAATTTAPSSRRGRRIGSR